MTDPPTPVTALARLLRRLADRIDPPLGWPDVARVEPRRPGDWCMLCGGTGPGPGEPPE